MKRLGRRGISAPKPKARKELMAGGPRVAELVGIEAELFTGQGFQGDFGVGDDPLGDGTGLLPGEALALVDKGELLGFFPRDFF